MIHQQQIKERNFVSGALFGCLKVCRLLELELAACSASVNYGEEERLWRQYDKRVEELEEYRLVLTDDVVDLIMEFVSRSQGHDGIGKANKEVEVS